MNDLVEEVLLAVTRVVGDEITAVHEPSFMGNEIAYLKNCIDTNYVSSVGPYVDEFEIRLAEYIGVSNVVAVCNGTVALQVALQVAGVAAGDEVLVPTLTFVGTVNAVSHIGATPHFVDSEEATLGIDPVALESWLKFQVEVVSGSARNKFTGKKIAAIVPVHVFGHPCKIDEIIEIAARYNILVIEDAAESLGSFFKGKHSGTFGKLGVVSFNGNKIITTGGGGAIITDDPSLAKQARHLTTTAKVPHRWRFVHDQIGYNYRMPNINAALGCAQLEQIEVFLSSKRNLHQAYQKSFAHLEGLRILHEPAYCRSNYWLQGFMLDDGFEGFFEQILDASNSHGIATRPLWALINKMDTYSTCPSADLSTANRLSRKIINLPSSSGLI